MEKKIWEWTETLGSLAAVVVFVGMCLLCLWVALLVVWHAVW